MGVEVSCRTVHGFCQRYCRKGYTIDKLHDTCPWGMLCCSHKEGSLRPKEEEKYKRLQHEKDLDELYGKRNRKPNRYHPFGS